MNTKMKLLAAAILSLSLTACGGGGSSTPAGPTAAQVAAETDAKAKQTTAATAATAAATQKTAAADAATAAANAKTTATTSNVPNDVSVASDLAQTSAAQAQAAADEAQAQADAAAAAAATAKTQSDLAGTADAKAASDAAAASAAAAAADAAAAAASATAAQADATAALAAKTNINAASAVEVNKATVTSYKASQPAPGGVYTTITQSTINVTSTSSDSAITVGPPATFTRTYSNTIALPTATALTVNDTSKEVTLAAGTYTSLSLAKGGFVQVCEAGTSKFNLTDATATPLTSADVAELAGKTFDFYQDCAAGGTLVFDGAVPGADGTRFADFTLGANPPVTLTLGMIKDGLDRTGAAAAEDYLFFYKKVIGGTTYYFISETQKLGGNDIVDGYVAR